MRIPDQRDDGGEPTLLHDLHLVWHGGREVREPERAEALADVGVVFDR
jgi:hypothetical protein